MKFGSLLGEGDVLQAGDMRLLSVGRSEKMTPEQVQQFQDSGGLVQTSGGILSPQHDPFFREQDIEQYEGVKQLRAELLAKTGQIDLMTKHAEIMQKHLKLVPPIPRDGKTYQLRWEDVVDTSRHVEPDSEAAKMLTESEV